MLRTVPVWNRAKTPLAFLATGLLLGGLLALALAQPLAWPAWAAALALETLRRGRFFASYRRSGV
jgi:DMSO reductase anchor subunit